MTEETVGVGIVALGTCLPEISCSIIALVRKKYHILVGSIIGSNIFNIFTVLGIAAIVNPFQNLQIHYTDLLMLFGSIIAIFPILQKTAVMTRTKGGILFSTYLLYLYHVFVR
jgi:cation:H+ antiporter